MPLGAEAEGAGGDDAGLEKDVGRRILGIPDDDEIVAVPLEGLEAGGSDLLRKDEEAPIGAAVFAGGFDFFAGVGQRDACFFLRLNHDFRAGGGAVRPELDHAVADFAVFDEAGRVAGRNGDVARVLSLASQEFANGVLKHEAVPGRSIGFLPRGDDAGQRDFDFFLKRLVFLFGDGQQFEQLALEPREGRGVAIEREFVRDRALCAVDVLHESAEGRVLLVERKLFDDFVDLLAEILCQIAMLRVQLADESGERAALVVEREFLEHLIALLALAGCRQFA